MDSDAVSSSASGAPAATGKASGMAASSAEDQTLLAALRGGDEMAFATLVSRYQPSLQRLALTYVHDAAIAQEVVQDTWLGVLKGLDQFQARASLKTWIFRILINRAKTSAAREGRLIPFSAAWDAAEDMDEPAIDPDRFQPAESAARSGWWASPPSAWSLSPEDAVLAEETRAHLEQAVSALPDSQREVITLRDIEGLSSTEVCNLLHLTETNQRVLLHRARSRVRRALERYFDQERQP